MKNLTHFDCQLCTQSPKPRFWTERRLQLHMKVKHKQEYKLKHVTPPVLPKI
jgi:hypothetical protein